MFGRGDNIEKEVLKMQGFPIIQKDPVYNIYRYVNKENKLRLYGRRFHKEKIAKFGLKKVIDTYEQIFKKGKCSEVTPDKNINVILKPTEEKSDPNLFGFAIRPYEESLEDYLKKYEIDEDETVSIMRQVIEAIYTIIQAGFKCCNIRAENFVKVWKDTNFIMTEEYNIKKKQKTLNLVREKYAWKLDSLPEYFQGEEQISRYRPFTSQFIWCKAHQAPEFYTPNEINPNGESVQQSLVWSIGSIFLDILAGTHLLGCIQNIQELHDQNYQIESFVQKKTNRKIRISLDTKKLLQKMLQMSPKERMKLGELFKVTWLCEGIKKFLQKKITEEMNQVGIAKYRASQNFSRASQTQSVFYFRKTVIKEVEEGMTTKYPARVEKKSSNSLEYFTMQESIKKHAFINMEEFFERLISILHKGDTIPITMQEFKMLDFLKKKKNIGANKSINISRTNKSYRLKKKPSNAVDYISEQSQRVNPNIQSPFSGQKFTQIFTACLIPYKRQYQKCIFLSLISERVYFFQQEQIDKYMQTQKMSLETLKKMKDDQFLTRAKFFKIRLIILHSLSQAISLSFNLFNIGDNFQAHCNNIYFSPTNSEEWILFVTSGIYNALKIFIEGRHHQCLNDFTEFLEKQKNDSNSPYCQKQFGRITSIPYKVCPIQAFMPIFKEMRQIMKQWNAKFKETENKNYLRNIAYLAYSLCCHKAHEKGDEQKNFKEYAGYSFNNTRTSASKLSQSLNLQDSFNFAEYDNFLSEGNIKQVDQHFNQLCETYLAKKN